MRSQRGAPYGESQAQRTADSLATLPTAKEIMEEIALNRRATWRYWDHVAVELNRLAALAWHSCSASATESLTANVFTRSLLRQKTISQACSILGAAKQLRHRLFVRENRPDQRLSLFCVVACFVEQDRAHQRTQRSLPGFFA